MTVQRTATERRRQSRKAARQSWPDRNAGTPAEQVAQQRGIDNTRSGNEQAGAIDGDDAASSEVTELIEAAWRVGRYNPRRAVQQTAGIVQRYAKRPAATIAQERDAFERGVADEVTRSMGV